MARSRPTSLARPADSDPSSEAAAEAAARRLDRRRTLDAFIVAALAAIPWPDPTQPAGPGRPTVLTPANAELALRSVAVGNYPSVAIQLFTNLETWSQWQERAQQGEPLYAGFVDAMARAQAYHHTRRVARVDEQADESGRTGIALLERRYRDHWAPQAAPTGPSAPTVNVQVLAVSDLSGLASLLAPPNTPPQQLIEGQIIDPNS